MGQVLTAIGREPIDLAAIERHLADPACGAQVVFIGVVRAVDGGRAVRSLYYEAYEEMAAIQLEAIAVELRSRWPLARVAIMHRLGQLEIGQTAVVVGVSSPHRAEAFEACRFGIDAVKRDVTIWKRQDYADSTASWCS